MKNPFLYLLKSFEFESLGDLCQSLAPSFKYQLTVLLFSLSAVTAFIQQVTGLQVMAVIGFVVVMSAELVSGIKASAAKNGQFTFSSQRFSRFLFKLFYYFAILFFCQAMMIQFTAASKTLTASMFDWIHTYLVVHIGGENIISILENVAVIEGKPKTFYLEKIKERLSIFK